jgi:Cu+-exporting ATPase
VNATDIAVVVGGIAVIAALAWYFFAPRKAVGAQLEGGRQVVDITVRGGYSPNRVTVEAGKPVRLRFDRQENSDCSARVVFPDLRKSATLAAFGTTTLDLDITEPGEYSWACGMNMLHGTLIAEAPGSSAKGNGGAPERSTTPPAEAHQHGAGHETARAVGVGPRLDAGPARERAEFALPGALRSLPTDVARAEARLQALPGVENAQVNFGMERAVVMYDPDVTSADALTAAVADATGFKARLRAEPGSESTEDAEAADRRAEVRDLKIRVGIGALLTLPVLYASMVMGLFGEQYVPDVLMNRWVQLALTLPVFLWIGWAHPRDRLARPA